MPTLEVYLPAGHRDARKAELIDRLTAATVAAIGAPAESVRILLSELPATHIGLGGRSAADGAPPALPVIVAILISGRADEQKRALIAALSDASAAVLDAPLQAIRVIVKDIPTTDFGIGGKTAHALGR
ncbi:2-hydroxymuconate tautomerase family protein [Burkholderia oklahomensis]|uniref:4-oxalocrotonate tautomerase enzyme family protein n=1 Tax=Burkholderia oklahomensis TaxID=342113 RepID=A0AAI8FR93_9BURK|nr:2-hydroxymuconate tautomerase family protein [Burkholderia oklahomensis]AIO69702.1 4-oxalocrotonate tautomerase enzyme family protein [Burkholderia oklahomensis]AJX36135.1 4-oxalocrotonate tautomerase enzyme family protein [Burkholderia oklahomensis C6786]AOI38397.1 4-oxalocrotonate tautomerase [Burkholderia oklahomensis EO147]AOI48120.1 4-oxalocrotonate tautomerase [Burkholderia oklahomensis C6786]KUY48480.1 4-oxalocrotonate tautomerase [Burkholderia oklahomensis EO147]